MEGASAGIGMGKRYPRDFMAKSRREESRLSMRVVNQSWQGGFFVPRP